MKSRSQIVAFLRTGYARFLEAQQVRMSNNFDGLPLLALLGLVCGLLAGGLIILFRYTIDNAAALWLPGGSAEGFEGLSSLARFTLCVVGGLVVGLILHFVNRKRRQVGVVHVLERLDYHQGRLPFSNAVIQFVTATISLLSGQSVGREGPSVHLGAAAGSLLGRSLQVPNNSLRILIGCGVAAAIAAAFNTPLAGVIFAMEVVIMEYTVIGFTPVIIAAVSSTTLTRIIIGDESAFSIPDLNFNNVQDLPMVAIMGAIIGSLAAGFIQLTLLTNSVFGKQKIWLRTTLAGIITGLIAIALPQVMGTGYDTVDSILLVQFGLLAVAMLVVAKIAATATAIGLGIPAGLIGPTLFIGAAAGGAFGLVIDSMSASALEPSAPFYSTLGMAAMMAATLQAPLAALIYLLELTANPAIILPGMTAVITASLVTRVVFGKSSIYRHLMLSKGVDYRNSPLSKALRRIGVASVMERNIIQQQRMVSRYEAEQLLRTEPRWILLNDDSDLRKNSLLPATDLARYLNELDERQADQEEKKLDLLRIPAKRLDTAAITIVATLQEAYEKMESEQCDLLFIQGAHGGNKLRIYGVITREHIEKSYRF